MPVYQQDIITSIDDFLHLLYYGNIKLCPSTTNLMKLLHLVIENNENKDMHLYTLTYGTCFCTNIEPLIQQVSSN